MSQDDDIPAARSRSSRWPGWIWAVPIAAVAIVGWLAAKEFLLRGPEVTVTFGVTGGVKASDTKVKFQGRDVGHVTDVSLHGDLTAMDVTLQLDSALEKHLGSGTRFWITDASPSLSNLSSLTAIVSGPSIGIDPHPGGKQDHYRGLTSPPAIKHPEPGLSVTLASSLAGGVGSGTPVFYRDLQVGEVESRSLDKDGRGFTITAFVKAPFDRLVHSESRFWNAGAVQVAMKEGGPELRLQSVPALFSGAIAFETPDRGAGPAAPQGARFQLYDGKDRAVNAPGPGSAAYTVVFPRPVAELKPGAAVELAGTQIGVVRDVALEYDRNRGTLSEPVTIALEPGRLRLANEEWRPDARPQMDEMLRDLIGKGLRARIGATVPVIGGKEVELAFVPEAAPASLGGGSPPEIPNADSSTDVQDIVAKVDGVVRRIDAMPLPQIASDIHETTSRLAA